MKKCLLSTFISLLFIGAMLPLAASAGQTDRGYVWSVVMNGEYATTNWVLARVYSPDLPGGKVDIIQAGIPASIASYVLGTARSSGRNVRISYVDSASGSKDLTMVGIPIP